MGRRDVQEGTQVLQKGGKGKGQTKGMWVCEVCQGRSFLSRVHCFICEAPRPHRVQVVEEWWKDDALAKGRTGAGRTGRVIGGEHAGKGREAGTEGWKGTLGGPGKGPLPKRMRQEDPEARILADQTSRGKGPGGDVHGEGGRSEVHVDPIQWPRLEPGISWADASEVSAVGFNVEDGVPRKGGRRWVKGKGRSNTRRESQNEGPRREADVHDTGKGVGNMDDPRGSTAENGCGRGQFAASEVGSAGKPGEEVDGVGDGLEEEFPTMQGPFVGPILPRDILAARLAAVEERVSELQTRDPGHPKV